MTIAEDQDVKIALLAGFHVQKVEVLDFTRPFSVQGSHELPRDQVTGLGYYATHKILDQLLRVPIDVGPQKILLQNTKRAFYPLISQSTAMRPKQDLHLQLQVIIRYPNSTFSYHRL